MISPEAAIAIAKDAIGVELSEPAKAWFVRRLDHPGQGYFLVVFGAGDAATGVAAIAADTGDCQSHARLSGTNSHFKMDRHEAIQQAKLGDETKGELVWKPCKVSTSILFPFWEIRAPGRTVYVDHRGRVHADVAEGHG